MASTALCSECDHVEQLVQDIIWLGTEYLQEQRLHHLSGLGQPLVKRFFLISKLIDAFTGCTEKPCCCGGGLSAGLTRRAKKWILCKLSKEKLFGLSAREGS